MNAAEARLRFETENKIENVDADELYRYDQERHQSFINQRAWLKE